MNGRIAYTVAILLALLLAPLCTSCGTGPTGGATNNNEMHATINGGGWAALAKDISAVRTATTLSISGLDIFDGSELVINIAGITGPGSYRLDSTSINSAEFVTTTNTYRSRLVVNAGTLTLTHFESGHAEGSFQFTARSVATPTDTVNTVFVQDGVFAIYD